VFHQIAQSLDFHRNMRLFSSARMAAVGVAGLAVALAAEQCRPLSLLMGGGIAVLALILLVQVGRSARHIASRSQLARTAAAQAEQHYISVLRRIVRIVEARDRYMHGHSQRVGQLSGRIGRQVGLDPRRCDALVAAGELLDIGLLAVSDEVLGKRAGFGPRDFRSVQKHSDLSYEVLKPLVALADVLDGVRYHHERMNGTGYPRGLSGDDIPLEARILAVADSYDAMTHDRPHRPAMSTLQALRELQRCSPAGYDPQCVRALAQVLDLTGLEQAQPAQAPLPEDSPAVPAPA
jgi:HD-GYP domain-containing protein (c-di-GMP phosphodiesterase class II)